MNRHIDVDAYRRYLSEGVATAEDLAADLLVRALESRDVSASEVKALAGEIGLPWGTVRRLKREFRISSRRVGGKWWWHLPEATEDDLPLLILVRRAAAERWIEQRAAYRRRIPLEEL